MCLQTTTYADDECASSSSSQAGGWGISGEFDVKSWDLQRSLQIYHNQYNRGGLFSWAVGADERESTKNIIQLDQGGLGLPSRDYYLNKTDKNAVIEAYLDYMIKIGELMGGTNVEESMKDLLELERKIAIVSSLNMIGIWMIILNVYVLTRNSISDCIASRCYFALIGTECAISCAHTCCALTDNCAA